ncbi:MAG: hypothetical protein PHT94_03110 [Candidatus Nanoarchaeia archaeon]|nr:hypothetical protein [Candidatus Nanoarchaeia archaeon]
MKKKGDLSIGIIIAAAVGVLVLVVMGAIFINQMKGTTDDIKTDCSRLGGIYEESGDCKTGYTYMPKYNSTTQKCCVKLTN